jgi:hypothetical protein
VAYSTVIPLSKSDSLKKTSGSQVLLDFGILNTGSRNVLDEQSFYVIPDHKFSIQHSGKKCPENTKSNSLCTE